MRRKQFSAVLASSNSGYTTNKYLRLMMMVSVEILLWTPLSLYLFIDFLCFQTGIQPYVSWDYVHAGFNTIYSYDRDMLPPKRIVIIEIGRWIGVIGALVFFAFVSLTPESVKEYKIWVRFALGLFTVSYWRKKSSNAGNPTNNNRSDFTFNSSCHNSEEGEKAWSTEMSTRNRAYMDHKGIEEPCTPTSSYIGSMPYEEGVHMKVERHVV
ncbi:hypothetical protein CBS101457_003515 [Exobasidium rhododendri]|nr:hypothetical protein CBS101457_003515 [Exobasidium rhododendri]